MATAIGLLGFSPNAHQWRDREPLTVDSDILLGIAFIRSNYTE